MFKIGFLLCVGWEAGKLTVKAFYGVLAEILAYATNKNEDILKYMNSTLSLEERRRLKRNYRYLNIDVSEPEPKEEIVNKIGF